jgi:hypothetical protein
MGGIFPGMISSEEALDQLGDKVVEVLSTSVAASREDLTEYREFRPIWVQQHSPRGLANWISDRLWAHVCTGLDDVDEVEAFQKGVIREIVLGTKLRLRIKRHHLDGAVSTYPTQMALEFMNQPMGQLPGMETTHLIFGYEWDRDLAEIGSALLSLRDGQDNVIWKIALPETAATIALASNTPDTEVPSAPRIRVVSEADSESSASEMT